MTPREKSEAADVVFEGVALPGDAAEGLLLSPARFRVERYLKGSGPSVVLVEVGRRRVDGGRFVEVTSVGIGPAAGERWRIFGKRRKGDVVSTSTCSGSGVLGTPQRRRALGRDAASDFVEQSWFHPDRAPLAVVVTLAGLVATLLVLVTQRLASRRA